MQNQLPKDPVILLSVINTRLRDYYSSLDELCRETGIHKEELTDALGRIDYEYSEEQNQFV
ncbi:MAG: DUF4250 domain-containing protein [Ruminococcus sp.]|nr:DUF4250 domain-containing protein [Ruminococcus sp.]